MLSSFELRSSDFLFFALALYLFLEAMNVLFVAHYEGLYGANRSLLSLLEGLQEHAVKPFFVVPREGGVTKALSASHVPYKIAPVVWWMTDKPLSFKRKVQVIRDLCRSVEAIRRLVREWKIDVIYTNTSVSPVGMFVSLFEHVPHIWHIREFGDLDFSLRLVFPRVLTYALIRSSAAIICHAHVVRAHHFKPGTSRVHLIYNGSATRNQYDDRLRQRSKTAGLGDFVFAIVSTVTPKKGQEAAIRAMAVLLKLGLGAKLLVAGSGGQAYVDQLKGLAKDLNVAQIVEFVDFVENPYEIYSASDCVLICSEHEALSRVALEAMSACVPVIGKKSGGTPEIIVHERTGLLYSTFDELVGAMARMVGQPDWGCKLGMAGWKVGRERFNIEDYSAKVYEVIKSVSKV